MKRRLEEFGELSPAERKLRDEICDGQFVILGDGRRPGDAAGPDRQVRAEFLRYLILGGCAALPGMIPENGVRVKGALITDTLDLKGARIPRDVLLAHCRFAATPNLMSAQLDTLDLTGSALPGLVADRLQARGDVFLRNAKTTGEIRLLGADLGGDLTCNGAEFTAGDSGTALTADRLRARGDAFLRRVKATGEIRLPGADLGGGIDGDGAQFSAGNSGKALTADGLRARRGVFLRDAEATGEIRLPGAELGGDLDCDGAEFTAGESGKALSADGLRAKHVFLSNVEVTGEIRLLGADLGGDLVCDEAQFMAGEHGDALNAQRASIAGAIFLRGAARVDGVLDLTAARTDTIEDDATCWPERGNLKLNRCQYGAFTGTGPVTATARIRWLSLQNPARWGEDFWPHPWEECARVLREMGHGDAARRILIDKEIRQRKDRRQRLWRNSRYVALVWAGFWDFLLGITVRYGRQPLFAFLWLLIFWLAGAGIFGNAAAGDAIKPNNAFVLRSAEWVACAPGYVAEEGDPALRNAGTSQLACFRGQPEAASYPAFNALVYSADTLLPIVALEMQEFWIPDETQGTRGRAARVFLWVQIMLGWALSLLAVAGFSGLVRSD